ncbi:MAG: TrmB family transcriptional regulator [Bacillus sp. (in: firmicutes)]
MQDIIQQLQSLGFSQYESKAYLALVIHGPTSAYQISKESGIPRSRIYEILHSLIQQGIVMKEEINETIQYSSIPVDIFLKSIHSKWNQTYESINHTLKRLENTDPVADNRVIALKSKGTIQAYCHTLLQKVEKKIIVSLWKEMYQRLENDLKDVKPDCRLQGIVFGVEEPLKSLELHRETSYTNSIGGNKWFILSIDGREMVYGHETGEIAFYTDDPIHIYLLENYIWHDILVNRLAKQSGENTETWISSERDAFFS